MCKILESLSKYVPSQEYTATVSLPDGTMSSSKDVIFHQVLIGGDQLTCARVRGAQSICANHETNMDKLSGFTPVVEDWHTKMTLLKVL